MKPPKKTRTAHLLDAKHDLRAEKLRSSPSLLGHFERKTQELAAPALPPEVIGGEVLPDRTEHFTLHDTLSDPDSVAVDASLERMDLLQRAQALELGLDLAKTIGAANSAEKMLAHGIAACHANALQLLGEAANRGRIDPASEMVALKKVNAAARLMDTAHRGMETLVKIRTAGQQTITVRQVHINGGQNIIADNVTAGGAEDGRGRQP